MLSSLKIRFISLSGEEFFCDFEALTEKKIGEWSEISDFIMPFFKYSWNIFVVMTLSIIVADLLTIRVCLLIKAIVL